MAWDVGKPEAKRASDCRALVSVPYAKNQESHRHQCDENAPQLQPEQQQPKHHGDGSRVKQHPREMAPQRAPTEPVIHVAAHSSTSGSSTTDASAIAASTISSGGFRVPASGCQRIALEFP